MARRTGASSRSRRLATALRRLRSEANLSCEEVGLAAGMSTSKLSRIEQCKVRLYRNDLEVLLDIYRVDGAPRAELLELAERTGGRDPLATHSANLPADWQVSVDVETEASTLLSYQPLTIPGLLQTAEYARAILRATGRDRTEAQINQLVASRMARQGLLTSSRPLRLHAIIEESVLTRPIGDEAMLGRQLSHLAHSAALPSVRIQVIPTDAGLHSGLNGPFVLVSYGDEPSAVLLENNVENPFLADQRRVAAYADSWHELAGLAHDEDGSAELIRVLAATAFSRSSRHG